MNPRRTVALIAAAALLSPVISLAQSSTIPSCVLSSPPRTVTPGSTTRLIWYTENATAASIGQFGAVPAQGYRDVTVYQNTLYTMTVWNGSVSRTCSAAITVTPAVSTPIATTPVTTYYTYTRPASSIIISSPAAITTTPTYTSSPSAGNYINIPSNVPVYNTNSSPGTSYGYVSEGHDAPAPGEPFINVDTYYDPSTDTTYEAHYGCVMGLGGDAMCPNTPLASYSTNSSGDETYLSGSVDNETNSGKYAPTPYYPTEESYYYGNPQEWVPTPAYQAPNDYYNWSSLNIE